MEATRTTTPDGITWYIERFTPSNPKSPDPIVLIPSGEGDCGSLRALGDLLSQAGYHTLSFDNPGFSRTTAPPEAYAHITPQLLARQIVKLLTHLSIPKASFFGNSSGGGCVLALATLYPNRVKCGIVHEVPIVMPQVLLDLNPKTDDEISAFCADFFANHFVEQEANDGRAKWDALGAEYHARLKPNYVTWIRSFGNHYVPETGRLMNEGDKEKRAPVFWTVGSMSDRAMWAEGFDVAKQAGIEIRTDVLDCLHFPYVTVPEKLSEWIVQCVESMSTG